MTGPIPPRDCRGVSVMAVLAMLLGLFASAARANFVQFTIPANADVVAESSAAAPSGIDSSGHAFLSATQAAARAGVGEVGNGLPDNGQFVDGATGGTIQLLPYTGNNVVRLSGAAGGSFTVNVNPANYQALTIYATCGDAAGTVTVALNYSDGTVNVGVTIPEWFTDPPPAGEGYLIDGLDRTLTSGAGFEDANDPAIFAIPISPDQTRTLNSITFTRTSTADAMNFFAVTGNDVPASTPTPTATATATATPTPTATATATFVQFTIPANADVVAESSAPAPAGIDSGGRAFLSASQAAARAAVGQVGNGLPDNGQFIDGATGATIQLLPYTGNNVVRLSGAAGGTFMVNVTPANYQSLTIYATCGDASGTVAVDLNYSDGSVSAVVTIPEWFTDPPPAGEGYLIDGLDRTLTSGAGFEDANDPAIFAIPISPDQTRTLNSITFTRTSTTDSMNFFAVTGNEMAASPTPTPTATATATPTATATATAIPTATPTATATAAATATPTATPTGTPSTSTAQTLNLSTRVRVETGDKAMIAGFIITGQTPKNVVLRGLGPSLSKFGLTDLLLDPVLQLRGESGNLILEDDNWKDVQRAEIEGGPFQPEDDRESVIITTLPPATYTAILTGKNQTTGIGVVEVYDNNQQADSQLANISTRGFVQTDDKVMIGGFTLDASANPARIAVRALGPSLSSFGLTDVLQDPTLELHDQNGTIMISNDDWTDDPVSAAELTANGLALSNPKESGIFSSNLPPGQFTAIVAGKNGGVGIGLVEIYNLR